MAYPAMMASSRAVAVGYFAPFFHRSAHMQLIVSLIVLAVSLGLSLLGAGWFWLIGAVVLQLNGPYATPEVTATVYTYKLQSAYILILPGLGLKIISGLVLWFAYAARAWWMRIKFACTAFLTVNAFVFLVPMMPELLGLAEASIPDGSLSQAFLDLEGREKLVGMSNVIPLANEMIMGAFRPAITANERAMQNV